MQRDKNVDSEENGKYREKMWGFPRFWWEKERAKNNVRLELLLLFFAYTHVSQLFYLLCHQLNEKSKRREKEAQRS